MIKIGYVFEFMKESYDRIGKINSAIRTIGGEYFISAIEKNKKEIDDEHFNTAWDSIKERLQLIETIKKDKDDGWDDNETDDIYKEIETIASDYFYWVFHHENESEELTDFTETDLSKHTF